MIPIKSSSIAAQKAWCYSQALCDFDGNEDKAKIATDAFELGVNYIHSMPIGCNIDNVNDFEDRCYKHIESNIKAKPSGFFLVPIIGGWFFWAVMSGLISWAVQRLMDIYFPKKS